MVDVQDRERHRTRASAWPRPRGRSRRRSAARSGRASSTTSTACEPKIVEKFAVVRNVSGRRIAEDDDRRRPRRARRAYRSSRSAASGRVRARAAGLRAGSVRSVVALTVDHPGDLGGHGRVALLDDALLRHVVADELAPDPAAPEDEHAVAEQRELLVVRARAEHVHAALARRPRGSARRSAAARPTSTPCVGSSSSSSRGSVWNHFASSAFCWLPPLSAP